MYNISITPNAHLWIKKHQENNHYFRFDLKVSGCTGFAYIVEYTNEPKPNEQIVLVDDIAVLLKPENEPYLKGVVIDLKDEGFLGKRIVFNNPNVKNSCGCGESIGF